MLHPLHMFEGTCCHVQAVIYFCGLKGMMPGGQSTFSTAQAVLQRKLVYLAANAEPFKRVA